MQERFAVIEDPRQQGYVKHKLCDILRACLVSYQEQADKGKGNHLEGIVEKSLAILPKSAAFVKPAERALHNPTLRKNRERMKLIPLYNLHFRSGNGFDGFRELFACISSVSHDFL